MRVAFLAGLRRSVVRRQGTHTVSVKIVTVTDYHASRMRERRRRLSTHGVDVTFTVSCSGVLSAQLVSIVAFYLDDTGPHGLSADISPEGGTRISTEVVSEPAAAAAGGAPIADDGSPVDVTTIACVAAAIAAIAIVAVASLVLIAVIVARRKHAAQIKELEKAAPEIELTDLPEELINPMRLARNGDGEPMQVHDQHHSNPMLRGGEAFIDVTPSERGFALTILPAHWEQRQHEGTPFYENTETGEKSWAHPSEEPASTLPAGWEQRQHEGTLFYENTETGEKSWAHPSEEPASTLPAHWEQRQHEGTLFYENTETGEKSWAHPSEGALSPG